MEMYSAALYNPKEARESAFLFLRDNSFESDVPKICKHDFASEGSESKKKWVVYVYGLYLFIYSFSNKKKLEHRFYLPILN